MNKFKATSLRGVMDAFDSQPDSQLVSCEFKTHQKILLFLWARTLTFIAWLVPGTDV